MHGRFFAEDSIRKMHFQSTELHLFWKSALEINHDTFPGDLVFKKCACGNFILSFVPWRSQNASLPLSKLNPQIRVTYAQNASAEEASEMFDCN